jgi:hypothetical protein
MTPKEKALELFDKYWTLIAYKIEGSVGRLVIKQCALIAVNEILDSNPNYPKFKENEGTPIRYWEVVKQEIEKL